MSDIFYFVLVLSLAAVFWGIAIVASIVRSIRNDAKKAAMLGVLVYLLRGRR